MLLTSEDRGVYPIALTPFDETQAIDYPSLDRLIDFYIQCGVEGVTLLGILGEPQKLTDEEQMALVRHVLRRTGGRLKVIVGASRASAVALASFASEVMAMGAAGLMISPAPTVKHEEQLLSYFSSVTRSAGPDTPIVLQDFPRLTGVTISPASMDRLIETLPSIKVIKHEEDGGLRKISRNRDAESKGRRRVAIWVGNSGIHLPQELGRGADGANTGIGFPEILVHTCRRYSEGRIDDAENVYDAALPVIRHEHQPGIGLAIRKEIYRRRGIISSSALRAPAPGLDERDHEELTRLLRRLERRLDEMGLRQDVLRAPVC